MPYSHGIAFPPCSPPGGDTLLAALSKAFGSLPAVVGTDAEARWDPAEGCRLGEAFLGRRWGLSYAKAAPLPPACVTVSLPWLSPLLQSRKEGKGWLHQHLLQSWKGHRWYRNPGTRNQPFGVRKRLFPLFSRFLRNRTFYHLCFLWFLSFFFLLVFFSYFFVFPAAPLFEPMMFVNSK